MWKESFIQENLEAKPCLLFTTELDLSAILQEYIIHLMRPFAEAPLFFQNAT